MSVCYILRVGMEMRIKFLYVAFLVHSSLFTQHLTKASSIVPSPREAASALAYLYSVYPAPSVFQNLQVQKRSWKRGWGYMYSQMQMQRSRTEI